MPLIITTEVPLLGGKTSTPFGVVKFTKRGHAIATVEQSLYLTNEVKGFSVVDDEINPASESKASSDGIYSGADLVQVTALKPHAFGTTTTTPYGKVIFNLKGISAVPAKVAEYLKQFDSEFKVDDSGDEVAGPVVVADVDEAKQSATDNSTSAAASTMLTYKDAQDLKLADLKKKAILQGVPVPSGSKKEDILASLFPEETKAAAAAAGSEPVAVDGPTVEVDPADNPGSKDD